MSEPRITVREWVQPSVHRPVEMLHEVVAHVRQMTSEGYVMLGNPTTHRLEDGGYRFHFTWGRWPIEERER